MGVNNLADAIRGNCIEDAMVKNPTMLIKNFSSGYRGNSLALTATPEEIAVAAGIAQTRADGRKQQPGQKQASSLPALPPSSFSASQSKGKTSDSATTAKPEPEPIHSGEAPAAGSSYKDKNEPSAVAGKPVPEAVEAQSANALAKAPGKSWKKPKNATSSRQPKRKSKEDANNSKVAKKRRAKATGENAVPAKTTEPIGQQESDGVTAQRKKANALVANPKAAGTRSSARLQARGKKAN